MTCPKIRKLASISNCSTSVIRDFGEVSFRGSIFTSGMGLLVIFVGGVAAVADPCEDIDWPASLDSLGGSFGIAGFGSFHFVFCFCSLIGGRFPLDDLKVSSSPFVLSLHGILKTLLIPVP